MASLLDEDTGQGGGLLGMAPRIGPPDPNNMSLGDALAGTYQAVSDAIERSNLAAVQAGLLDPETGWPTPKGAVQSAMNMGMGLGTSDLPGGIRAYHGSPYSFDAFDASKIGTGEGAQAYGHGLYFAESEPTARFYRDNLTSTDAGFNAMDTVLRRFSGFRPAEADVREALSGHDSLKSLVDNPAVVDAVRKLSPDYQPSGAVTGDALRHYRTINDAIEASQPKGSMYEVGINADPQHFLDWDKPLSEQSQHVQGAVTGLEGMTPTIPGHVTGGQLVDNLQTYHGNAVDAAQALRDKGVAGIRYLDAGSRASGEGSRNYVVFDPATIEILRKYGIAGLGLGLGAAATQGNGQ